MKHKDTLLIVVPDHATGGPNFVGMYDITKPDSALTTDGFPKYTLDANGIPSPINARPIMIQWAKTTGHTGDDVTVSARDPIRENWMASYRTPTCSKS